MKSALRYCVIPSSAAMGLSNKDNEEMELNIAPPMLCPKSFKNSFPSSFLLPLNSRILICEPVSFNSLTPGISTKYSTLHSYCTYDGITNKLTVVGLVFILDIRYIQLEFLHLHLIDLQQPLFLLLCLPYRFSHFFLPSAEGPTLLLPDLPSVELLPYSDNAG
jgi:hypothetical protein